MKNALLVLVIALASYFLYARLNPLGSERFLASSANGDVVLANAFEAGKSDLQIQGQGTVTRILPDDRDGSPHQRFVIRLNSGQTLLISHNIALAPRIPSLGEGDSVEFNGEYEWNSEGGVIHWTHHDPAGSHQTGWLKHEGRTYQ